MTRRTALALATLTDVNQQTPIFDANDIAWFIKNGTNGANFRPTKT